MAAPGTPDELIAICGKAMSRKAEDRYSDTTAMAEDLRAYLEGRVVQAYEVGAWAEFKKWVMRNKELAATVAGALLITFVVISWSAYQQREANLALGNSNAELGTKNDQLGLANESLADANSALEDSQAELQQKSEEAESAKSDRRAAQLPRADRGGDSIPGRGQPHSASPRARGSAAGPARLGMAAPGVA